jgi:hypothetical protein
MGQSSLSSSCCSYDIVSSIKQRGVTKVFTQKIGEKRSDSEHANLVSIVYRYTDLIVRSGLLLLLQRRAAV